jgi:hypothetical protein
VDPSWTYENGMRGKDLLDDVVLHFSRLRSLTLTGPIATNALLANLPRTLKILAWRKCPGIQPVPLAKFLRKTVGVDKSLPELVYVSVLDDDVNWSRADRKSVAGACQMRGVKFYGTPGITPLPDMAGVDEASENLFRQLFGRSREGLFSTVELNAGAGGQAGQAGKPGGFRRAEEDEEWSGMA